MDSESSESPLREGKYKSGSKEPSGKPRPTNHPPTAGNPQKMPSSDRNQSMNESFKQSYGTKGEKVMSELERCWACESKSLLSFNTKLLDGTCYYQPICGCGEVWLGFFPTREVAVVCWNNLSGRIEATKLVARIGPPGQ